MGSKLTGLLALLAIAGYQNRDKIAEMLKGLSKNQGGGTTGGTTSPNPLDSLGGRLGGGTATAGGLLSGGLDELVKQFTQNGQKETADSWVGTGANREIAPPDLKQALGPDMIQQLARATGISEQQLLATLSKVLPTAVDRYTPDGRIPHG